MTFEAGQEFLDDGIFYRVLSGSRCDGDLVIEFSFDGENWKRPKISHSQILVSFKFQVEENNYGNNGKVKRGRGGWYLLDSIKRACVNGWETEAKQIEADKQMAEIRRIEQQKQMDMFAQAQLSLPT